MTGQFAGRRIALLTRHGKERVISPVLDSALGCRVELVNGFDTDSLGTFSRDIPRAGTQLQAARRKARIGMELSGLAHGLASEGAFIADPVAGIFPWNIELLVFIDDERGIEVTGMAQQATRSSHLLTDSWTEARQFAVEAGFPEYHLVLRPQHQDDPRIAKDICNWAVLEKVFFRLCDESENCRVFLEHDTRAHAHPARMNVIRMAAENLVIKLNSACPACDMPGFSIVERVSGLPCADCGMPTREFRAEIYGCVSCDHQETRAISGVAYTDPGRCDFCNP